MLDNRVEPRGSDRLSLGIWCSINSVGCQNRPGPQQHVGEPTRDPPRAASAAAARKVTQHTASLRRESLRQRLGRVDTRNLQDRYYSDMLVPFRPAPRVASPCRHSQGGRRWTIPRR